MAVFVRCVVKRARKRTQIVGEILDTERTYVQGLHVIVGVRTHHHLSLFHRSLLIAFPPAQVFLNPLRSALSGPCPVIDTQSLTQVHPHTTRTTAHAYELLTLCVCVVCRVCLWCVCVRLQIFSIVEALLAVNQELLKNLEQRYKHWSQRQTIGDVFLQMVRAGPHFSRGPVGMPS